MPDFFSNIFFYILIIQSVTALTEKYLAKVTFDNNYITPYFYYTIYYDLYNILNIITILISIVICCIKYSWWLIIVYPLVDFIISTTIVSWIYTLFLRNYKIDICRAIFLFCTVIMDIIIIIMWF